MKSYRQISALNEQLGGWRREGRSIGFVPTMGFLHEGHLSLVRIARRVSDCVVASLFVNPLQFNDPSDLAAYPVDTDRDLRLLMEEGVEAVFFPDAAEIYPQRMRCFVKVGELSEHFEGKHRPGHFQGVSTVVAILFNIVRPDVAVFGEKDFQQLRIIEEMVRQLHYPITIHRAPLVREEDGLAMSSRNVRLSDSERKQALSISRGLRKAQQAFREGESCPQRLEALVRSEIEQESQMTVDYAAVVNEGDLVRPEELHGDAPARLLVAASVGGVRLIDNILLSGREEDHTASSVAQ